jgi:uncharacterized protein
MSIDEIGHLTQFVLWGAFAVSVGFGAIVQRTGFCTMGAVADAAALGDWTRMRQWALAAGVAIAGLALLSWFGLVNADKTLYASNRWLWLSALAGGSVFGFGMVLASGCASKTLVRVGGGNLKALVVSLVIGVTGFATLKGLTAVWRTATVDRVALEFAGNATLPGWLAGAIGAPLAATSLVVGAVAAAALIGWALAARELRSPRGLLAGLGVGASVLAIWWITGHLGHVGEHPETLQESFLATNSTRAEALNFVSPIAYGLDWLMFFSDASKHLTVGIVSTLGVVCGSAAVALAQRSFRWEGFADTSDLGHHLAGGALMGVGGVTAMGCSIGQGISGLSTLSLTSLTALAAILAGAVAGLKYQMWRIERASPISDRTEIDLHAQAIPCSSVSGRRASVPRASEISEHV